MARQGEEVKTEDLVIVSPQDILKNTTINDEFTLTRRRELSYT